MASQVCFFRPKALQLPPSLSNGSLPGKTAHSQPLRLVTGMRIRSRGKCCECPVISCPGSPRSPEPWPATLHGFGSSLAPQNRFKIFIQLLWLLLILGSPPECLARGPHPVLTERRLGHRWKGSLGQILLRVLRTGREGEAEDSLSGSAWAVGGSGSVSPGLQQWQLW